MAMPDRDSDDSGDAVEVALPVGVPDKLHLATVEQQRFLIECSLGKSYSLLKK
jgi:hypothetical protein